MILTDVDTAHTFMMSLGTVKTLRCLDQQHVSNVSAMNKKINGNQCYVVLMQNRKSSSSRVGPGISLIRVFLFSL